jgi:ATP synthase protein I
LQRHDVQIVRGAALATLLTVPLAVLLGWLAAARAGAIGAGAGILLAAAFFSVTVVVVAAASRVSNELMLPAALGVYLLKLVGLLVALVLLRGVTVMHRPSFALAVVAGTCVYLVAEVRMALRARIPYAVVGDAGAADGDAV